MVEPTTPNYSQGPIGNETWCYVCDETIPVHETDWGWVYGRNNLNDSMEPFFACKNCKESWVDWCKQ